MAKETKETEHSGDVDKATVWNGYLRYLKEWANTHRKPKYYGMTPTCFDKWLGNEYGEEQANDSYMCCLHDTPRTKLMRIEYVGGVGHPESLRLDTPKKVVKLDSYVTSVVRILCVSAKGSNFVVTATVQLRRRKCPICAAQLSNHVRRIQESHSPSSFKVAITETLQKIVTVDAANLDEAEQTASDN